jgi:hypothetical protein
LAARFLGLADRVGAHPTGAKRKDLEFNWMFVMFGVFILACGVTHFMSVWNVWHSAYRLDGVIKAITALASISTAILMFRLVPQAVALPSPEDLRKEIEDRTRAEAEVLLSTPTWNAASRSEPRSCSAPTPLYSVSPMSPRTICRSPFEPFGCLINCWRKTMPARWIRKRIAIGFVVEASARMQSLVADLLTYSRVLDPEAPKEVKTSSSARALQTAILDLQQAMQDSSATIQHEALPDLNMDETQLKQLFQNPIGNAIKYRRPEEPLKISVAAESSNGSWLFSVKDNGIGIEAQYLVQIFEAFKRLHGKEYPGSGTFKFTPPAGPRG